MALAETIDLTAAYAQRLRGDFAEVAESVCALPAAEQVRLCGEFRRRLDAIETVALARAVAADQQAGRKLLDTRRSTRADVRRRTGRAALVAEHPDLGRRVTEGSITGEQLDILVHASDKSDGAAPADAHLVERISRVGVEQGRSIANEWLDQRASEAEIEAQHARQRKLRTARRFDTSDGLAAILMEGDRATIDVIWAEVQADANAAYMADGGRDLAPGKHPRTSPQRLFDSLAERLGPLSDPPAPGSGAEPSRRARPKPVVMITVDLDRLLGSSPSAAPARLVGSGSIPDSVLKGYLAHADIVGGVFSGTGQPLWLGRKVRSATRAQLLALAVRDKGCVLCGTPWAQCHAHHVIPFESTARGPTDIDNLAFVCGSDHRRIHGQQLTLVRTPEGDWTTRPAHSHEIAARGPVRSAPAAVQEPDHPNRSIGPVP